MEINILNLYPDLLNLYGDRGNILAFKYTFDNLGIKTNIKECLYDTKNLNFKDIDIIMLGGASDREQRIVQDKLFKLKNFIEDHIGNDKVLLAICAGFQMLGKYYETNNETIEGLNILEITTKNSPNRRVGNIVLKSNLFKEKIVGFENHSGVTNIDNYEKLGETLYSCFNNSEKYEGILYKNLLATYLHGPFLPLNPEICDYLVKKSLNVKYELECFKILDREIENNARNKLIEKIMR